MSSSMKPLHVDHLWSDSDLDGLDPLGRLVYRSNRLGDDQRVTNTGGGNTSSKGKEGRSRRRHMVVYAV